LLVVLLGMESFASHGWAVASRRYGRDDLASVVAEAYNDAYVASHSQVILLAPAAREGNLRCSRLSEACSALLELAGSDDGLSNGVAAAQVVLRAFMSVRSFASPGAEADKDVPPYWAQRASVGMNFAIDKDGFVGGAEVHVAGVEVSRISARRTTWSRNFLALEQAAVSPLSKPWLGQRQLFAMLTEDESDEDVPEACFEDWRECAEEEFAEWEEALSFFGLKPAEVVRLLSAIILLGELTFDEAAEGPNPHQPVRWLQEHLKEDLTDAAGALGVQPELLLEAGAALGIKSWAKLAEELYKLVLAWVVSRMNEVLAASDKAGRQICLLEVMRPLCDFGSEASAGGFGAPIILQKLLCSSNAVAIAALAGMTQRTEPQAASLLQRFAVGRGPPKLWQYVAEGDDPGGLAEELLIQSTSLPVIGPTRGLDGSWHASSRTALEPLQEEQLSSSSQWLADGSDSSPRPATVENSSSQGEISSNDSPAHVDLNEENADALANGGVNEYEDGAVDAVDDSVVNMPEATSPPPEPVTELVADLDDSPQKEADRFVASSEGADAQPFIEASLARSLALSGLSLVSLTKLAAAFQGPLNIAAGEDLASEGAEVSLESAKMIILESGSLEVYQAYPGVKPPGLRLLQTKVEGYLIGELTFLHGIPSSVTVLAEGACSVWALDRATFNEMLEAGELCLVQRPDHIFGSHERQLSVLGREERVGLSQALELCPKKGPRRGATAAKSLQLDVASFNRLMKPLQRVMVEEQSAAINALSEAQSIEQAVEEPAKAVSEEACSETLEGCGWQKSQGPAVQSKLWPSERTKLRQGSTLWERSVMAVRSMQPDAASQPSCPSPPPAAAAVPRSTFTSWPGQAGELQSSEASAVSKGLSHRSPLLGLSSDIQSPSPNTWSSQRQEAGPIRSPGLAPSIDATELRRNATLHAALSQMAAVLRASGSGERHKPRDESKLEDIIRQKQEECDSWRTESDQLWCQVKDLEQRLQGALEECAFWRERAQGQGMFGLASTPIAIGPAKSEDKAWTTATSQSTLC